ncbi:MAG: ATP-binding protein [Myxococcota bacterium]|jgi:tRNA 2-thiocytidine biosynthesis protein TtcA|nr:ATP-binding protein [Myxococcota bacterium]
MSAKRTGVAADTYLHRKMCRSVRRHAMIEPGERVAVGISGGKDSLTLLDLLSRGVGLGPREANVERSYQLVALHVDGHQAGLPDLRQMVEAHLLTTGLDYEIVSPSPADLHPGWNEDCLRCARMRRKALFEAAVRQGCTKLALGHHADDVSATALLNLLYRGTLEGLSPMRPFFGGLMTIIRPLLDCPAEEIASYARRRGWSFPPELQCPRSGLSHRAHVEAFLRQMGGRSAKQVRTNIARASTLGDRPSGQSTGGRDTLGCFEGIDDEGGAL